MPNLYSLRLLGTAALPIVLVFGQAIIARAADLRIGAATIDITPDRPVALDGQRHVRISKKPATAIQASAIAIESPQPGSTPEQAIMISCDLVAIRDGILQQVRSKLQARLPGFDVQKLCLNATHTHTAPVSTEGRYALPEDGSIMSPTEYAQWMTDRVADVAVQAWQKLAPGKVAWGQSQAVIAQNRRPYYANGTATMYGPTNSSAFRGIEGHEDHTVDILFFWDAQDQLIATVINLPCPSQEVGGGTAIHADFWDPIRQQLRARYGNDFHIIAWTGAAGDVTSKLAYGQAADDRMRKLRGNRSRLDELAKRILWAWDDAYEGARHDSRENVVFKHQTKTIDIPFRQVTREERNQAAAEASKFRDNPKEQWNYRWNQSVVDRYEAQQAGTEQPYRMELHALRLGDVAIGTNEFELYTDFGIQMKARSPAIQTFVIQLAGPGTYLPTERAAQLGGYGAVIQSSRIGPEGGQVLVEETVKAWQQLWQD